MTCFGYLGYKNARFGRIEAHEAVTAGGREALLRAKEVAEELGFTVLHMYVDALWVKREGARHPDDFQPLLEAISRRTGLSIALDGVYRWVAFLPSRRDGRVPVANRYFGVFQDGSVKLRGLEARRRDTPVFVSALQQQMIACLAKAETPADVPRQAAAAVQALRRGLRRLYSGDVPLDQLLVGQKLSRKLEAYTTPSPSARAAQQLQEVGKILEPGQRVYFLWLRGRPDVHAWDLPCPPAYARLDLERYTELALRAAEAVLYPFGITPICCAPGRSDSRMPCRCPCRAAPRGRGAGRMRAGDWRPRSPQCCRQQRDRKGRPYGFDVTSSASCEPVPAKQILFTVLT